MSTSEQLWKKLDYVTSGELNLGALQEAYQEWSETYDEAREYGKILVFDVEGLSIQRASDTSVNVFEGLPFFSLFIPEDNVEECDGGSDHARLKYNGPAQAAKKLSQLMPDKSKKILDVACGTGMVGKELQSQGFVNIDGVDMVQDMLNHAERTGIYSKLDVCDVIGKGIPCEDDLYDAIVCVASFNQGYVSQAVFPEFCRVAKKGCIILIVMKEEYVYTCPDFRNGQLDTAISMLAQNGTWKYVFRERIQEYVGDYTGLIYVMEVQ